jgi:hypothetical protein
MNEEAIIDAEKINRRVNSVALFIRNLNKLSVTNAISSTGRRTNTDPRRQNAKTRLGFL